MGKDNDARSEQLGMPYGTANNRLRKAIMFKYVQIAGHDKCFSCGDVIEDIDHLSIEHKKPWQGRDVSLFWDLDNIAFSHLSCNTRHDTIAWNKGMRFPPEQVEFLRCGSCHEQKHRSEFHRQPGRYSGSNSYCKPCRRQRRMEARINAL